jgi:hypothetical protein
VIRDAADPRLEAALGFFPAQLVRHVDDERLVHCRHVGAGRAAVTPARMVGEHKRDRQI